MLCGFQAGGRLILREYQQLFDSILGEYLNLFLPHFRQSQGCQIIGCPVNSQGMFSENLRPSAEGKA
jgi:hypothetical protein